jgi:hypothetical protein
MRSDHYLHPELGFLAPTARLRRELRVGLLSMLFGVGIGVVAVTALSLGSRDQDHVSAYSAGTSGTVGTASGAARQDGGSDRRGGAASTDPNETTKAATVGAGRRALSPTHDSPAIARLPLGHSDTAGSGTIKSKVGGDLTPRASLAPGTSESIPLPREKTVGRNAVRQGGPNGHEESGNTWTGRADGSQTTSPSRAPSRDSSRSLRGFWAWSW